jgi:FkbM family methyltransferase
MKSTIKKSIPSAFRGWLSQHRPSIFYQKRSYSQSGEDLVISFLLNLLHGSRSKKYLDLGAHHPYSLSNTALLYEAGGCGILVEPDPNLAKKLADKRPRDTVLECGVHFSGEVNAEFFVIDPPTLNTFSRKEMERYVAMGHKLKDIINVELMNVNSILKMAEELDLLSIDIEGLDKDILEQIDWQKYRPTCVCIETISYEKFAEPKKIHAIRDIMIANDYILYADTFINSIFVDRYKWKQHWNAA